MDKIIIQKIIDNIILKQLKIKCRTELSAEDKRVIEQFKEEVDSYPKSMSERKGLYQKHVDVQAKHTYTESQTDAVYNWNHVGFRKINGRIYQTDSYKQRLKNGVINDDDVKEETRILQSAIDDSPRVPNNTVTLRKGHWERGHKEGDIVVQKGFGSTSYTRGADASETSEEYKYNIKYYIPTGTKGIVIDRTQFYGVLQEEELLLGRNTRQYVLSQDDNEKTVEILILPDM